MKAGILSFVINTPFTNPKNEPTISVNNTAGTPLYAEKVETLVRTINSHHKAKTDEIYIKEMAESIKEIQDPKSLLHNTRCNPWDKIPDSTIKIIDYKIQHMAGLNFLARRNITFKDERISILCNLIF